MSNLPISAKDRITFRPYDYALELTRKASAERIATLKEALDAAKAEDKKSSKKGEDAGPSAAVVKAQAALEKAETSTAKALEDAETELAARTTSPVYTIRVPLPRITAAVSRDVNAEGVPAPSNADIIDALYESVSDLGDDDAAFVEQIKIEFDDLGKVDPASWDRAWTLAKRVPAAAQLIADRAYRWERERFHLIRHCTELPGQRTPLSESAAATIPAEERVFIAMKIAELLRPSEEEIKN